MAEDSKNILVVEDEKSLVHALEIKLHKAGYAVTAASNGQEAIDLLKNKVFDLILLDLMMPVVSGFRVLKAAKADPRTKDIPIIVLSNLSQPTDESDARQFGATDYIVKSDHSLREIAEKIHNLIDSKIAASN